MPALETLQVQYLVKFITNLLGDLVSLISGALVNFGAALSGYAADDVMMQELTTGIFGRNGGLIYWINEKVFYLIEELPWADLGDGLGDLIYGILNGGP